MVAPTREVERTKCTPYERGRNPEELRSHHKRPTFNRMVNFFATEMHPLHHVPGHNDGCARLPPIAARTYSPPTLQFMTVARRIFIFNTLDLEGGITKRSSPSP